MKVVLCLAMAVHVENGLLPKPCLWAEPGPVLRWGQPVTIVCRSPAGADTFRLEDKDGRSVPWDQRNVSQHGSQAEGRFPIDAVSEFTARSYFCHYHKGPIWSERSEILELKVADEDVFPPPSGAPRVIRCTPDTGRKPPSTAEHLSPEHLYVLVGICVAFLLCLLLLILLLAHRQHRKKRGPPSSKGEEPRPQERPSPTVDLTESTAEVASTVDALPEENRDMHSPSPAAEDPQEVTYAQLDQRALTRRAAHAESPQPTEPTADSSMYSALPRH